MIKTTVYVRPRDKQAGFRSDRSCTDHIATLRIIIEQSIEWDSSLYMYFVDFVNAFDSVDRENSSKLLQHHGIPKKILKLVRSACEPSTRQVIHDNKLTELFNVLTGVKEGCPLSPVLFLLTVD